MTSPVLSFPRSAWECRFDALRRIFFPFQLLTTHRLSMNLPTSIRGHFGPLLRPIEAILSHFEADSSLFYHRLTSNRISLSAPPVKIASRVFRWNSWCFRTIGHLKNGHF